MGIPDHEKRRGEHYGPYGTACANTGQFDAGFCWKCQIRSLKLRLKECEERLKEETQHE